MIATQSDVVTTGLRGLDRALGGGLRRGGLTTIVGPTSSGKTGLMVQILAHSALACRIRAVAVYLESSGDLVYRRLVNTICQRDVWGRWKPGLGVVGADEGRKRNAAEQIARSPLSVLHGSRLAGQDLDRILAEVKAEQQRGSVGLVALDYAQLVDHADPDLRYSRLRGADEVCRRFRDLARETNAAALIVRQFDRDDPFHPGRRFADQVVELAPRGEWLSDRPAEVVPVRVWHRGAVDPVRCRLRFTKECTRFDDIT